MIKKLEALMKDLNILLVEDELDLRAIIAESIEPYVNDIYEASNGSDGLELFFSNSIDLIITDINMVRMNGLKMVRNIREYNPKIPTIFLTAYDTDENILEAIELHNSYLLKKPFDKKQLITTIQMMVGQLHDDEDIIDLHNGFTYSIKEKELYFKDELISLTKIEKRLLQLLIHNRQHTVSFEMIDNFVWQEKGATQETIRTYIKKLRKKTYTELIQNIQGMGYLLKI